MLYAPKLLTFGWCGGEGCTGGYCTGVWGLGWVLEGLYRVPSQLLGEGSDTSGAGPVGPAGAGVGGYLRPGAQYVR